MNAFIKCVRERSQCWGQGVAWAGVVSMTGLQYGRFTGGQHSWEPEEPAGEYVSQERTEEGRQISTSDRQAIREKRDFTEYYMVTKNLPLAMSPRD